MGIWPCARLTRFDGPVLVQRGKTTFEAGPDDPQSKGPLISGQTRLKAFALCSVINPEIAVAKKNGDR